MESQCLSASSFLHPKIQTYAVTNPAWKVHQQHSVSVFFKSRISYHVCACQWMREEKSPPFSRKTCVTKAKRDRSQVTEEAVEEEEKKGTITGAVALIIGTSIGSGILALPQKASPAGVLPSSISMILCWAFLLIEALLLIEINVALRKKRGKGEGGGELEVISIRTMAQETLGDWDGTLATVTYVFLGYTSMIAYSSKSGEILFHLINLPESVSSCFFTALFTILLSVGGTKTTDQVNQWLTASMIGLLVAIEILAVQFGGWSGSVGSGDWGKVPATIPVIIFSLVYHDIAPVLCAYLGGDLKRLRASVLLGSLVPLFALLVWNAVSLGLSAQVDQVVDPVQLLMRVKWSGISYMVEAFSLLAVGTSLLGTLLGFSEFFKEQLKNLTLTSPSSQILQERDKPFELKKWWERNNITFTAMAAIVAPTLLVSISVPDAFSAATDIAGGYCMTMLYGVLPPAMAWASHGTEYEDTNQNVLSRAKPALFGVGLFACGIVAEQILQDVLALQS
ncbi:tyrosine-specific transport protein-like isoform X2 [Tripterygium wilfordii]|uniref:tyrosine-specific transport protein-like isoform X2 n=1 Tax=Tripterygium wilfordii TaxID=458696 RepID=UPI0018F81A20|nr:tyrosine-specific transport protein-like isoform X2 [Tripterygium wilfordii]